MMEKVADLGAGMAYPGDSAQANEDRQQTQDSFIGRDYTHKPDEMPKQYNWVMSGTHMAVGTEPHEVLFSGLQENYSLPHAYGGLELHLNYNAMWSITYTNMAIGLVEKRLKRYTTTQGWNYEDTLGTDNFPISKTSGDLVSFPSQGQQFVDESGQHISLLSQEFRDGELWVLFQREGQRYSIPATWFQERVQSGNWKRLSGVRIAEMVGVGPHNPGIKDWHRTEDAPGSGMEVYDQMKQVPFYGEQNPQSERQVDNPLYCSECDYQAKDFHDWHDHVMQDHMDRHEPGIPDGPQPVVDLDQPMPADFNTMVMDTTVQRQATLHKAEYNGWSNWHTWNTALMMDNEVETHDASRKIVENGGTAEQLRDWTISNIIGPANQRAIQNAQEWNSIPEHDRLDYNYEDFKEKHPEAMDLFHGLVGGPDTGDANPSDSLIDPELVNWQEIYDHIKSEFEENDKYDQDKQRLQTQGLDFGMPGHSDETNQMLDAWLKHHGALPDHVIEAQGGKTWDHPQAEHRLQMWNPLENIQAGGSEYSWPEGFGDKHVQEIQQNGGWNEGVRSVGWNTLWDVQRGRPNPYTDTMRQALEGQGYPPEQVQHIMRQRFQIDPITHKQIDLEAQPKQVDQTLDQPGQWTIPDDWSHNSAFDQEKWLEMFPTPEAQPHQPSWEPRMSPGVIDRQDQEAMYFHQCPMCKGYLRDRGGPFTCDNCGYEIQPTERTAAGKIPDIQAPIPFIFSIDSDRIYIGSPGSKHSDIKGMFIPGGVVEGMYDPKGNVQIMTDTDTPYTIRHMLELWYAMHPELLVKAIHKLVGKERFKMAEREALNRLPSLGFNGQRISLEGELYEWRDY